MTKPSSVHHTHTHTRMLTDSDDLFFHCFFFSRRDANFASACARRRLSSRLDNIKKTARGDGHSRCLLCGASFGPQGVTAVLCAQCKNVGGLLSRRHPRGRTRWHALTQRRDGFLWQRAPGGPCANPRARSRDFTDPVVILVHAGSEEGGGRMLSGV